MTTTTTITDTILSILKEKLRVNEALLTPENYNEPLTGSLFQLQGLDLTYLYCFIQEAFGVKIPAEHLLDYQFNTINGINCVVLKCQKPE